MPADAAQTVTDNATEIDMSAHGRHMNTDEEPIAEISSPSPAVECKNCRKHLAGLGDICLYTRTAFIEIAAMFDATLVSSMSYVVILDQTNSIYSCP